MGRYIPEFHGISFESESENPQPITKLFQSDHMIHINGYKIECFDGDVTEVRIDGRPTKKGTTYMDAVTACLSSEMKEQRTL